MITAIKSGGVVVDLDVQPHSIANTIPALKMMDNERRASIARGERIAYVYTNQYMRRDAQMGRPRAPAPAIADVIPARDHRDRDRMLYP